MKKIIFLGIFVGVLIILLATSMKAEGGQVHNLNKDTWYSSIQDAINDANDGDTIYVYSGIYYENVVINKRINLIGENKETTIIDGSNSGDVVNITANGVSIEGFTIRNSGSGWPCAGVKTYYANNVTIYNCKISNNWDGIWFIYSSNNSIYNCKISNNQYGIRLRYSSNNEIHYNNIYDNTDYGIYNCNDEIEYIVNASYNWWGSSDGPGGVGSGSYRLWNL